MFRALLWWTFRFLQLTKLWRRHPLIFFKKFGEVGWVVGQPLSDLRNGQLAIGEQALGTGQYFMYIKMTGVISRRFLYYLDKMFLWDTKYVCDVLKLQHFYADSADQFCEMTIQELKILNRNFFTSFLIGRRYCIHLNPFRMFRLNITNLGYTQYFIPELINVDQLCLLH